MNPIRKTFRHTRNYYLALLTDLMAPAIRVLSTAVCGASSAPSSWRKGLIISHTHIGDVLYRTGSLPHLAEAFPQCKWFYLCSEESATVLHGRSDIAGHLPFVVEEDSWTLKRGGYAALRRQKFDVVLCTNTLLHHSDFLFSVGLRIPNRVGFSHKGLSGLLTHAIELDYPSPFPFYFRSMVSQLAGIPGDWSIRPTIEPSSSDVELANGYYESLGLGSTPIIACCPATRQRVGGWPPELLFLAAERAALASDARVVLCGSQSDRPLLEALASRATARCSVMAGALSVRAFASFLARCSVVLAQDSAPRHLANAVETPAVFLRNISVSRVETGRYCDTEIDAAPGDEFVDKDRLADVLAKVSPVDIADHLVRIISQPR